MAPRGNRHRPFKAVRNSSLFAQQQSSIPKSENQERVSSPASTVDSWTSAGPNYEPSFRSAGTHYAASSRSQSVAGTSRSRSIASMSSNSRHAMKEEEIETSATQHEYVNTHGTVNTLAHPLSLHPTRVLAINVSTATSNNAPISRSTTAQSIYSTTGNAYHQAASSSSIKPISDTSRSTQASLAAPIVSRPRALKLPSVLDPAIEVIHDLPYSDAVSYLNQYNDFYASSSGSGAVTVLSGPRSLGAKFEDRKVDVVMFDCKGGLLRPTVEMVLKAAPFTTMPELVLQLQDHLDYLVSKIEGIQDGDKLLVATIEIKIFANQNFAGFPKIKGDLGVRKGEWKGEEDCHAEFVSWELSGEMREYWDAFLKYLTTSFQGRDKEVPPMIKIRTVRKVGGASPGMVLFGGGHIFVGREVVEKVVMSYGSSKGKGKERQFLTDEEPCYRLPYDGREEALRNHVENMRRENEKGGVKMSDTQAVYIVQVMAGISQHTIFNEKDEIIEEAQDETNNRAYKILAEMYRRGFPPMHDMVEAPASAYEVPKDIDSDKSWAYYQKKGSDPRMHEAFPMGVGAHGARIVPFIVDKKIQAKPGEASFPVTSNQFSTFATQPPGKESRFMRLIPEVPFHPGMIPFSVQKEIDAKKERFEYAKQQHEAAKGFDSDDDDQFLQPAGRRPPPKDESFYCTNALGRALNLHDQEQERRYQPQELQGQMLLQFASTTASQNTNRRQLPSNHQVRAATPQGGFFGNQAYGHGHHQAQTQAPVVFGPALPPGFIRGQHGGRGSVFGHIPHPARNLTANHAAFQQNAGLGNRTSELRADSPAFQLSAVTENHVTNIDHNQITPDSSYSG
jgi:hypothetical protein